MSDAKPTITPTEDGPYRLEGVDGVTRYLDGQRMPVDETAMLCRCGGSSNKPFCDGTHARNGFTDAKDPARVPDEMQDYTSTDGRLTVHDNRGLCAHSGNCGRSAVALIGTSTSTRT